MVAAIRSTATRMTASTARGKPVQISAIRLLVLVTALMAPTTAIADQLVVRINGFSVARPEGASSAASEQQLAAIPSGLPSTLRLPLATATDGTVTISLRQENLDGSVTNGDVPPAMRLRILSPAVGSVNEDAAGKVAIGMDTTLAFDDLATGKSRIFDVTIRGGAEAGAAYGGDLPIYVEAWRRGEDGKPVENPTKENRSFWGTLSGHFEQ